MYSARKPLTKCNLTRKPSIFGFHSLNNLRKTVTYYRKALTARSRNLPQAISNCGC